MTRALRVVVHNWPLKLAAIGLATLLYGGLVLPQGTETHRGVIPVGLRNQPRDRFLLTTPAPVTEVRYRSPSGVRPIDSTFEAWIDLSSVATGNGPVSVPIHVRSLDDRVTVLGFVPDVVTIQVDDLKTKEVPVVVDHDPPPAGLQTGKIVVAPLKVVVSGPASVVDRVTAARADIVIQASGISIDQDVPLLAVDSLGDGVNPVNLTPRSAHVTLPVFRDLRSKTLAVSPVIVGTPAPGFEIASVTVDPLVITAEGDAQQLATLARVDTAPVTVNGASSDFSVDAALSMPVGVTPLDAASVKVSISVRPVTATRSFDVGLRVLGGRSDTTYTPGLDRVLVTLGGSTADLDRVDGATLVANLDVAGLTAGTAQIAVTMILPGGVTLVSVSPARVPVTISSPPVPPSASPQIGPTASPGG